MAYVCREMYFVAVSVCRQTRAVRMYTARMHHTRVVITQICLVVDVVMGTHMKIRH